MRSFARTADKVQSTVDRVMVALKELVTYGGPDWFVGDVLILVPIDKRYEDHDCGELVSRLRQEWINFLDSGEAYPGRFAQVLILEVPLGDLFVGLQNYAINCFSDYGAVRPDIMITLAPSAFRYFDRETAKDLFGAFARGGKVASVMVPEDGLDEIVARGTAGGPITAWDLNALIEVGGFDERAAQPKIGEVNLNAGVEEIYPLVRIIDRYGACYAPIPSRGIAVEKRVLEGEDFIRHQKQIDSKTERQRAHARSLGIEDEKFLQFFASGLMPEYRLRVP